jgi:hypothetical protein
MVKMTTQKKWVEYIKAPQSPTSRLSTLAESFRGRANTKAGATADTAIDLGKSFWKQTQTRRPKTKKQAIRLLEDVLITFP